MADDTPRRLKSHSVDGDSATYNSPADEKAEDARQANQKLDHGGLMPGVVMGTITTTDRTP
jgi:hypothetical protein